MTNIITAVSQAIAEGSKLWNTWLKSRDKRRMESAIEAGESFIRVYYKSGEFNNISDSRRTKLLLHYSKRFWAYN